MKEHQVERASRIASLIVKRMQELLSPEEQAELEAWLREDSENYLLLEEMMDENKLNQQLEELQSIDTARAYDRLSAQFFRPSDPVKKSIRKIWYYAAAAVLLLAVSLLFFIDRTAQEPAKVSRQELQDIKPGGKRAILTLADGTAVNLDQQQQGIVAREGNSIIRLGGGGKLSYRDAAADRTQNTRPLMNVLSVPRGGEYEITLADGTKVWLNSVSTLEFPVEFNNGERRVTLTGEAYFQVAKNTRMPFIVAVNGAEVQALGTEFNINAYPDNSKIETALVEGKVKVSGYGQSQVLLPGSKAQLDSTGPITVQPADIEEVTAWKRGEFIFHNTPLSAIMGQLTRWYDIEVLYPAGIPAINYTGGFRRAHGIDKIINMIELTGDVRFEIDGKEIKVFPNL